MEPTAHPEADDAPDSEPGRNINWVIVVVGGLFALVVILHLTGVVGPLSH
jgi:hypothetical protein